jgi:hypothetical protein
MNKHIRSWFDLERYGICFLTGEACAYGLRLLFDLNLDGVRLISNFLGIRYNDDGSNAFAANWNSKVNGQPAIRSVLLPSGIFQELTIFCLFHAEKVYGICIQRDGSIIGLARKEFDQYKEIFKEDTGMKFRYNIASHHQEVVDGRNIHQMSGRIE